MNHSCTYCGYNALLIVRDYTGAPYASCPRCYHANPLYRLNPRNQAVDKKLAPHEPPSGIPKDAPPSSSSTPIS